jgi:hypothetical protein
MVKPKLKELADPLKMGIYQLFCKKSARLDQIKGFKSTGLLFTLGGRIVDSAHPQCVRVVVYQRQLQEDFL